MATMKPITRVGATLAEVAYERISDALLSGAIEPGERLVMDNLAAQLDISRTPVRDALARLEREGVIAATGRRGYVVRDHTAADTISLYEARTAVEGFAARRVAELGGAALEQVQAALDATESVDMNDPRAVYEANMAIHRSVVAATGNPMLVELFDAIWHRAKGAAAFADYLAHDHTTQHVHAAHQELVRALGQSPDAAFEGMRDHIRAGRNVHLE